MTTGQQIELNYARQLIQNYIDRGVQNETEAVWFSKEIILTALGLDPNTDTKAISGLRFYFGAYQHNPMFPKNEFDRDKLTLVMTHTGTDKIQIARGGEKEDFYIDIIDEPNTGVLTQPSYPDPVNPSANTLHTFNEGQCCPPPPHPIKLGLLDW